MVSDDVASRAVWLGADGVLAGDPAPDALAIECSTLSHDWVLELSAAVATNNLRYLDCPVTGLPDAAAAGQLTLLVGASRPTSRRPSRCCGRCPSTGCTSARWVRERRTSWSST